MIFIKGAARKKEAVTGNQTRWFVQNAGGMAHNVFLTKIRTFTAKRTEKVRRHALSQLRIR